MRGAIFRLGSRALLMGVAAVAALAYAPAAQTLPNGWAYELISPPDSAGVDLNGATFPAADGVHAWVSGLIPLTAHQPSGNASTLMGTRTATGWNLESLADPRHPGDLSYVIAGASQDSSRVLVSSCDLVFLACLGDIRYERIDGDGSRLTMAVVPRSAPSDTVPLLSGVSADLSFIVFSLATGPGGNPPLLPADTHTQGLGLYASHDGQLEFLGVDESGVALPCGAVLGNDTGGRVGSGFEQNGVSSDGRTVMFESPDPDAGCSDPVDVYWRRDGQSVNVSAPRNGRADLGATFLGSSRDGEVVYFTTASQLDDGDTDAAVDLYAYHASDNMVSRIAPGSDLTSAVVSPGGDYVYFLAQNAIDGQGTAGNANLFVYHAGSTRFIASAPIDGIVALGKSLGELQTSPVTPDGTHLLFASSAALTGQATGDLEQVFQYSYASDALTCISCPADGSTPGARGFIAGASSANFYKRNQSDDGSTVTFITSASLVPQDTNGRLDAYVWRDGAVFLLGSGQSPIDSGAHGMSADGRTVFFTSAERLLPGVEQDNVKFYAAREGGGFALAAPRPECIEDACQGRPAATPQITKAGSETFTGSESPARHRAAARVRITKITDAALRRLQRTGALALTLRGTRAGTVRIAVSVRVHGHWLPAASTSRNLKQPGALHIALTLSARARKLLRTHTILHFQAIAGYVGHRHHARQNFATRR